MKFRYLFLTLIALFPILNVIGDYNYRKTINQEELQFNIIVIDDYKNRDTIIVNTTLDIPKYYTLKKYILNKSDCTTCGDQSNTFYYNPTQESINEDDTLIIGFFRQFEKGRKPDSTLLSVTTYRNVILDDVLAKNTAYEVLKTHIFMVKTDSPNVRLTEKEIFIAGKSFKYVEYEYKYEHKGYRYSGKNYVAYIGQNNIFTRIELQDLTFNKQFQKDFPKILQSVKIKVEYKGKNEELTKHFQKH